MGTIGRPALPTNVHLMTGNRRKIPAHKLTAALHPDIEIPNSPAHLLPDAKTEWKRIAPELEKMRIISQLDRSALSVYCQAYARWVQAEKKLKELGDDGLIESTPSGYKQISVWLQISNRAVEQMYKFLCEFGMSPSSRSRVTANASPNLDLFEENNGTGRFFDK